MTFIINGKSLPVEYVLFLLILSIFEEQKIDGKKIDGKKIDGKKIDGKKTDGKTLDQQIIL